MLSTLVLEKTLQNVLEIKPVHPKRNQPWIFIGRADAKAEAPIYFGQLIRRVNSLEKTLILGKTEGRRRRGQQRIRWLDGITDQWTWVWADSRRWLGIGKPGVLQSIGSQRVRHDLMTAQHRLILYFKNICIKNNHISLDYWGATQDKGNRCLSN